MPVGTTGLGFVEYLKYQGWRIGSTTAAVSS
jgi:hypothetical protein